MKRTSICALLVPIALLPGCASHGAVHPMVKAAERVIDEITGEKPAPAEAKVAVKPSSAQP